MDLKVSKLGRVYAAFSSKPNAKDLGFPAHLIVRSGEFPARAMLTGAIGPVKDQGASGSCTGHGSSSMGERLYRYVKNLTPIFDPLYTYYLERQTEGTLDQGDCGAQVVTSLSVPDCNPGGGGFGWCPKADNSTVVDPTLVNVAPTPLQIQQAKQFPGGAYHNLGNVIANIKSCVISNYSFVIGIAVYQSFEDDNTTNTGLVPYPNLDAEQALGGHELHCGLLYDDTIQCPNSPNPGAVLCQNSWGTGWGTTCPIGGQRGFCWLSYDYILNPILTSDVRMGHLGRAW